MRTMGPFVATDEPGTTRSPGRSRDGAGGASPATCAPPRARRSSCAWPALCDVVCENFRPGTMEKWHLGPDDLARAPGLRAHQRLRTDGPYSDRARARPARHRLRRPAAPDRRPRPPAGAPRGDGVGLPDRGLRRLRRGGRPLPARPRRRDPEAGAVIDAALYGAILRILEWTLAGYDRLGMVRQREGNRLGHSAPLDNYPTADGFYVCIVAGSDANFARLCRAMEREDLHRRPPLRHPGRPGRHGTEINGTGGRVDLVARARRRSRSAAWRDDVPVGTAYSAADIFADPHMACAATWWRWRTRSSARSASRPPSPASTARRRCPRGRATPRPAQPGGLVRPGGPRPRRTGRPRGRAGSSERVVGRARCARPLTRALSGRG